MESVVFATYSEEGGWCYGKEWLGLGYDVESVVFATYSENGSGVVDGMVGC